jgi:hypothetical protein
LILRLADGAVASACNMAPVTKGDPGRKCRLLILVCVGLLLVVAGVGDGLSLRGASQWLWYRRRSL